MCGAGFGILVLESDSELTAVWTAGVLDIPLTSMGDRAAWNSHSQVRFSLKLANLNANQTQLLNKKSQVFFFLCFGGDL